MLTRCAGCDGELNPLMADHLGHCPKCNHYCIRKELTPQKYDLEYLKEYERRGATELGKSINRERWSLVQKYIGSLHQAKILDWGCGDGAFIRSKENGHYVDGYDVNPNSAYRDESLRKLPWDAVTLWDVIEHLKHPDDFIRRLQCKYLFLSTPNAESVNLLSGWKHYKPDEHQHYFSVLSMLSMLGRCRYKVVDVNTNEGALRDPDHPMAIMSIVAKKREE